MSGTMDRTVTVDGVTLYTRRRPGTAQPPLLLLHGIGGSLDSWTPLLDALPDRYLIMIDSPGAGRSAVPALPLRLPTAIEPAAMAQAAAPAAAAPASTTELLPMSAAAFTLPAPAAVPPKVMPASFRVAPATPWFGKAAVPVASSRHQPRASNAAIPCRICGGLWYSSSCHQPARHHGR